VPSFRVPDCGCPGGGCLPGGQAAGAAAEGARTTGRPRAGKMFSQRAPPAISGKRSLADRGERSERPVAGTDTAAQADHNREARPDELGEQIDHDQLGAGLSPVAFSARHLTLQLTYVTGNLRSMTTNPEANGPEAGASTTADDTQLFRGMAKAGDGNPRIAPNHLGVRIGADIQPDGDSNVRPNTGGMSVTPNDPMDLPQHRRPAELAGTSRWPVWWIHDRKLPAMLNYRPDPRSRTHGFVEPRTTMNLDDYQAAIAGTAPTWTLYV